MNPIEANDSLPFDRLWHAEPDTASNAIGYAKFFSRSHDAVIRVYDEAGEVKPAAYRADTFLSYSADFQQK